MSDTDTVVSRLTELRDRADDEAARLRKSLQEEIELASGQDDDRVDMAADVYERSKTISTIQSLEIKIRALEHAIEVATQGHYGQCERCGESIPAERLEIVPETTLCVNCAAAHEQGIRRHLMDLSQ